MQLRQAVIPGWGWLRPCVQSLHMVSCATLDDALPISHSRHVLCSVSVWYFPGMQFRQAVVPGFGWWLPLPQSLHTVSCATLDDALPISHSRHLLCSVSVWYFPGMQLRQAVVPFSD